MPKKIIENVYQYDNQKYTKPEQYKEPLFEDIDREMQSRTEDAQVDFLIDLSLLQSALPKDDHNKKVITNYIMNYFIPLDSNRELNKVEFEKRMEKLEERRMNRIYIPEGEYSLANKGKHSDEWIAQSIAIQNTGLLDLGIFNALSSTHEMSETITKAYGGMESSDFLREMSTYNIQNLLNSMPKEKKKIAREGLCYIRTLNEHKYTEEEKDAQKELEDRERASGELLDLDGNRDQRASYESEGATARYNYSRDMDLNFITDSRIYSGIQQGLQKQAESINGEHWTSQRSQDEVMDALSEQMAEFDRKIFDKHINGYRLFDSKEFNTIKDDLKDLQKNLKKGNSRNNLENIKYSLETFSKHCKEYLDKNSGKRFYERGNKRKDIVKNLKDAIDSQYAWLNDIITGEFEAKDNSWVNVEKSAGANKSEEKLKLSFVELSGDKKKPMNNNAQKDLNNKLENSKKGPTK